MTDDQNVLTVLLSLRRPRANNTQFVDLLLAGASAGVDYRFFSWREALTGDYDVLNVHWPELMIRDSRSRVSAFFKRRLLDLLIARLHRRRVPIVRTFHNPRPHEQGKSAEARSLARFDRATTLFLALTEHTRPDGDVEWMLVPHPHYAASYAAYEWPQAVPDRLLYFGIIRPYKNVAALVNAFRSIPGAASLHVVGNPHPGQAEIVRDAVADDSRVDLTLRYVDDDELVREVREASLVVLPYREMHNSGALLVAVSLARPALVPRSPVNDALAAELGPAWVRRYDGELTAELLQQHLREVQESGMLHGGGPVIQPRHPAEIGVLLEEAYRRAIRLARGLETAVVTSA